MAEETVPALVWLETNKNRSPFASNRFTKTQAINMVEVLMERFRANVEIGGIHGEAWRVEQEGGPYAATLYVVVPRNKERDFLRYVASTLRPDEFDLQHQRYRLWWD